MVPPRVLPAHGIRLGIHGHQIPDLSTDRYIHLALAPAVCDAPAGIRHPSLEENPSPGHLRWLAALAAASYRYRWVLTYLVLVHDRSQEGRRLAHDWDLS